MDSFGRHGAEHLHYLWIINAVSANIFPQPRIIIGNTSSEIETVVNLGYQYMEIVPSLEFSGKSTDKASLVGVVKSAW